MWGGWTKYIVVKHRTVGARRPQIRNRRRMVKRTDAPEPAPIQHHAWYWWYRSKTVHRTTAPAHGRYMRYTPCKPRMAVLTSPPRRRLLAQHQHCPRPRISWSRAPSWPTNAPANRKFSRRLPPPTRPPFPRLTSWPWARRPCPTSSPSSLSSASTWPWSAAHRRCRRRRRRRCSRPSCASWSRPFSSA